MATRKLTPKEKIAILRKEVKDKGLLQEMQDKQTSPSLSAALLKKVSISLFGKVAVQAVGAVLALDLGYVKEEVEEALEFVSDLSIEDLDEAFGEVIDTFLEGIFFEKVGEEYQIPDTEEIPDTELDIEFDDF